MKVAVLDVLKEQLEEKILALMKTACLLLLYKFNRSKTHLEGKTRALSFFLREGV